MSWKAEVIADDSGKWSSNALRFATEAEALGYAQDLYARWTLVREYRAVESDDPVNREWDTTRPAREPRPRAPADGGIGVEIIKPGDIGRLIAELTGRPEPGLGSVEEERRTMKAVAFDPQDFAQIQDLQRRIHNMGRAMTGDEQRDWAERLRLLLERAVEVEI